MIEAACKSRSANISRRAAFGGGVAVLTGCAQFVLPQPNEVEVRAAANAIHGALRFGSLEFPCALGRSGIVGRKREGDGGTPEGVFPLREVRYRPDRLQAPSTKGLPVHAARATDGWCDAPDDSAYNRLVQRPYRASAEQMWREDRVYDVVVVIGYNDAPPVAGLGSAIFLHVARPQPTGGFAPTAGCVALQLEALLAVLALCESNTRIRIGAI